MKTSLVGLTKEHKLIAVEQKALRQQTKCEDVECNGKISLVLLSCKRLSLLKETCRALFKHIDELESKINIEYILVDNGSGPETLDFVRSQRFDRIITNNQNLGIAAALNQGFTAATGEFIFELQDDWLCNTSSPFIQMSLDVLHEFDEIGIVRLKGTDINNPMRRNEGASQFTSTGVHFWPWFPNETSYGVHCFGCGIWRRQAYLYTGPIPKECRPRKEKLKVEKIYAKMFEKYYSAARIEGVLEAFLHTGCGRRGGDESPGWRDQI